MTADLVTERINKGTATRLCRGGKRDEEADNTKRNPKVPKVARRDWSPELKASTVVTRPSQRFSLFTIAHSYGGEVTGPDVVGSRIERRLSNVSSDIIRDRTENLAVAPLIQYTSHTL